MGFSIFKPPIELNDFSERDVFAFRRSWRLPVGASSEQLSELLLRFEDLVVVHLSTEQTNRPEELSTSLS
jgi:hypothetical protein